MPTTSPILLSQNNFDNFFGSDIRYLLLLDIDGTLSEFHPDPQQSVISKQNLSLMTQLHAFLPVWLVTGRSVLDARRLTYPLVLPVIGSHGLECDGQGSNLNIHASPSNFEVDEFSQLKKQLVDLTAADNRWLIEEKPFSIALHFREYPQLAEQAKDIILSIHQHFDNWQLKEGKFVWEFLPQGNDKGKSIDFLLNGFYGNYCPIFIGDDVTDESGFLVVQSHQDKFGNGGIGIKVGDVVNHNLSTNAHFYVNGVASVTQFLLDLVTLCQN